MKIEQKHFDAMMTGQMCRFRDDDREVRGKTGSLSIDPALPFEDSYGGYWPNCEPLKIVRYMKKPIEMMKTLIVGGWKPGNDGDFFCENKPYFYVTMWKDCGKPESEWSILWDVDPSWVEEREE